MVLVERNMEAHVLREPDVDEVEEPPELPPMAISPTVVIVNFDYAVVASCGKEVTMLNIKMFA